MSLDRLMIACHKHKNVFNVETYLKELNGDHSGFRMWTGSNHTSQAQHMM